MSTAPTSAALTSAVSFRGVTYTYPLSATPAVDDVSFELERGKCYGLIGANSSGKTTVCNIIRGLCPDFFFGELSGDIDIDGKPLADWDPGELGVRIGFVFQDPFVQISGVKETVFEEIGIGLENLGYDLSELTERVIDVAHLVGVEDLLDRDPMRLSGGQCQRVAFASVLVLDSDILVIDEPTSQLDPEGTAQIFGIVENLRSRGKTIILAEHKLDQVAHLCDELLVMADGELVASGPTDEVFRLDVLPDAGAGLPAATRFGRELAARGHAPTPLPVTRQQGLDLIAALSATRKDVG